jgi:hypothetical protein
MEQKAEPMMERQIRTNQAKTDANLKEIKENLMADMKP